MSDNQNSLSESQNDDSKSADDVAPDSGNNAADAKDEHVPKSVYESAKADLLKWKSKQRETATKLQEMQTRISELEQKPKDGEKNDYKAISDKLKKDLETERARTQHLQQSVLYNEKHRVVYAELKKLGLRDEAERLLEYEDFADLEVETTSKGRINVLNAKDWAEEFYKKNQYAFAQKKVPGVNSADGRNTSFSSDKITARVVVEAEMKYEKSKKPEDKARYLELRDKFAKQQARRA